MNKMKVVNLAHDAQKKEPVTAAQLANLQKFRENLGKLLRGKEEVVEGILSALLASGHILLEDVPGVGKTTLIKAVSQLLGLDMKRIQCTSDLLPSDIIGVEVFDQQRQEFKFHEGPLFSNIILADELNRASPRTQSALLEAMGEGFVTVDRKTYPLPRPFFVFASQNPSDHVGTYPLPESQLDRFAIKIQLNYPSEEKEMEIFQLSQRDPLAFLPTGVLTLAELEALQTTVESVHISDRVAAYVKRFVDATRKHESLKLGISTRGGVSWLRLARARAVLSRRDYVTPDDLIFLAPQCLSHRVITQAGNDGAHVIQNLLNTIDVD